MLESCHPRFRKTKIIATLGPATSNLEVIQDLYNQGMNIARINMSHGDINSFISLIKMIKLINKKNPNPIALLVDTQGPEIRTGDVKEDILLNIGDIIEVTVGSSKETERSSLLTVNYQDMYHQLNPGDKITVDNGLINLEVIKKLKYSLECKVIDGGLVKSRRHINLPGIRVNLPCITEKDKIDIIESLKYEVDFIALSFTRNVDDIIACKKLIKQNKGHAYIIAKIEDHMGVKNIKNILKEADGVMIARGDLGVEIPIEELPIVQRKIIKESIQAGKPCIVATHLLESMVQNPIPTRAEVTDVANAVYEEVDAVMLSAETSIGKYPSKSVSYLNKIASRIEQSGSIGWGVERQAFTSRENLAKAAVTLSNNEKTDAIVVITRRGKMAQHISSFHPKYSPILAFTNRSNVRRKLLLSRDCFPYRIPFSSNPEKTIQNAITYIKKKQLLQEKAQVIIISDILTQDSRIDSIQMRTI